MSWDEEDFLQLSGLQHFKFCRRQWALIHLEHQWAENLRTVDGNLLHAAAHDPARRERRGDTLITRGMSVFSRELGVSGQCDVLEFHRDDRGVSLPDEEGLWLPFPVEYKRGSPNPRTGDTLQLCGQAMCLEEMLCCAISSGALYYGEQRRRTEVSFTEELRQEVRQLLLEMHDLARRGRTPKARPSKSCNACSLKDLCLPALLTERSVNDYLREHMEDRP
jgi:CRISPR-associated exonuclease Cas4